MTEQNIKKLEQDEPGLAQACSVAPNPWESTYKIVKKFIVPQQDAKANKGDEKMKENLSKPASVNSAGRQGPLNNANLWSEASKDELYKAIDDLVENGLMILTLGQYLQPTKMHLDVAEFIHPETFEMYKEEGLKRGLKYVEAGPLVRSSYHAERHVNVPM
jgi:hypothetical protein